MAKENIRERGFDLKNEVNTEEWVQIVVLFIKEGFEVCCAPESCDLTHIWDADPMNWVSIVDIETRVY